MRVLVTDGDYKHTLAIVRSLGKEDHVIDVIVASNFSMCRFSKYSRRFIKKPENQPLEQLIVEIHHQYDFILPVGANSFRAFSKIDDAIVRKKSLLPDLESLNIALSKESTYQFAEKINVRVPKSFYPECFADLEKIPKELLSAFPLVIKGKFEIGSSIVYYVDSLEELQEKYRDVTKKHSLAGKSLPLIQEYIDGEGCGFFGIYKDGNCLAHFQHKRILEYPPSGGYSVKAQSVYLDEIYETGKKVLEALNWNGVAMVEFKHSTAGELILIEINPKFWGSLDLAIHSGVNFPKLVVDILNGTPIISEHYEIGKIFYWPMPGYILHILKKPFRVFDLLYDIMNPNSKSNINFFDDVQGTLGIFLSYGYKVLKKVM